MQDKDYFICPNCGAEVSVNAKICPECGADDETAWKADAWHGGTSAREDEYFDYEQTLAREKGIHKPSLLLIIAALVVALGLLAWLLSDSIFLK